MLYRVLDFATIFLSLAVMYGLPPALFVRTVGRRLDWTERLLLTFGAGLASQSVIGFIFNHVYPRHAWLEVCIYLGLWLVLTMMVAGTRIFVLGRAGFMPAMRIANNGVQPEADPPMAEKPALPVETSSSLSDYLLPAIILAGVALRCIDALIHPALGQSDAYSHLQFIRQILQWGQLINPMYPPGYTWTLALPTLTFHLDPYMMARYAGPFFGALLILAIYQLGRHQGLFTARFGAFLAACFPGFYLLVKTGMGAFANQLGLFFLPLALHLYLRRNQEERELPYPMTWFAVILLGLAASVPLLMFNLFLIVAVHRMTLPDLPGRNWWRESLLALIPFIPALALAAYHFLSTGDLHVNATASMITGIQQPHATVAASVATPGLITTLCQYPVGRLVVDLLTIKRMGFGNIPMNLAAALLALTFAGILASGIRTRSASLKLLGGWGVLATLQTTTGLLDFSLYQRSGWSLLEAIAWAGGVMCAFIYVRINSWGIARFGVMAAIGATLVTACIFPPSHHPIMSGGENELVNMLRELSSSRIQARQTKGAFCFEHPAPSPLLRAAAAAPHLTLVTRRYTLFPGDQGDVAGVVPDPAAGLDQELVGKDSVLQAKADHYICLIDKELEMDHLGVVSRISPELAASLAGYQPLLYQPNHIIQAFVDALPRDTWSVISEDRGPKLKVFYISRKRAPSP